MKRTIVLVGLLGFLVVAYFVHSRLKESGEDQVTIEWANSLVWAAIGSQSSVKFVEPKVAADAQPGHWLVTGEIVLRQGATETMTHPYSARVERLCEASDRRECWRLTQLVIGGSEVDLTGVDTGALGTASQTAAVGTGQVESGQVEAGQVDAGQVDAGQVDAGQVGAGQIGSGQAVSPAPLAGDVPETAAMPADGGAAASGANGQQSLTASENAGVDGSTPPAEPASEVATLSGQTAPEMPAEASGEMPSEAGSDSDPATSQYVSERRSMIAEIQTRLLDLGYDPGPVDGLMGPQTRTAIEDYQRNNNFTVNGEPSAQLLQLLERQE